MKTTLCCIFAAVLLAASLAMADQVTFSFVGTRNIVNLQANDTGMDLGAGGTVANVLISDTTLGMSLPLLGLDTGSTGFASSFTVLFNPNLVIATFEQGGANSVLITNPLGTVIYLSGIMDDRSAFLSTFPDGAGSFRGTFAVTYVNPTVLAPFGLSRVGPEGSFSATFAQANLLDLNTFVDAVVGGGSITIQAAAIPEPSSLALAGSSLLAAAFGLQRRFKRI